MRSVDLGVKHFMEQSPLHEDSELDGSELLEDHHHQSENLKVVEQASQSMVQWQENHLHRPGRNILSDLAYSPSDDARVRHWSKFSLLFDTDEDEGISSSLPKNIR